VLPHAVSEPATPPVATGRAEGRSLSAEGLGVSPNSISSTPQEWGGGRHDGLTLSPGSSPGQAPFLSHQGMRKGHTEVQKHTSCRESEGVALTPKSPWNPPLPKREFEIGCRAKSYGSLGGAPQNTPLFFPPRLGDQRGLILTHSHYSAIMSTTAKVALL
jgi:hypothetical protein